MPLYGNGMSGSVPSDYYYEDSQLRGRFPPPPQDPHRMSNFDILHMSQVGIMLLRFIFHFYSDSLLINFYVS